MRIHTYFLSGIAVVLLLLGSVPAYAVDIVVWSSVDGMKRLERSAAKVDFFPLANHFESQENKIVCGLASSAIVLNTLRLDDKAINKPQDQAVLSQEERQYLPKGFDPVFERYTQKNVLLPQVKERLTMLGKPVTINGKEVSDYGLQLKQLAALLEAHGLNVTTRVVTDTLPEDVIRKELIHNLQTPGDYVLVNYARKSLGQEGGGHISPLGAYDRESDSFLVLDVNPNTAPFIWVKAVDLIAAMRTFDTVENRGYVLVSEGKR